ncbi:MAG: DNA internalization-related competence protein ComEC/Rec2 [bacterium]|nr:DNA internalization-related competence protein ComEC/Rec2 [bacterium]
MLNKKPGFRAGIFFSAGILIFRLLQPDDFFILAIPLIIILCILILSPFKTSALIKNLLIITLVIAAGTLRTAYFGKNLSSSNHLKNMNIYNRYVILAGWVEEKQVYSAGETNLTVNILSLIINGREISNINGKVKIFLDKCPQNTGYGDEIKAGGMLRDLRGMRNPGEIDFKEYYNRKGVYAELRIPEGAKSEFNEGDHGNIILREIINPLRSSMIGILERNHSGDGLEFMKAILLGERSGLDREIVEEFKDAGTIHILAVSGLHVGFVVLIFQSFLSLLNIPKIKVIPLIMIAVITTYILLTGARPPVMRAGIFIVLYYFSVVLQKRRDNLNLLGCTVLILLMIDPNDLFDPGFQLSFSAVFGIFFIYDQVSSGLLDNSKRNRLNFKKVVFKRIVTLFLLSAGAFLGTAIISAYHFHRIVIGTVILNLAAIPLSGLIVCLGAVELIFGAIWEFSGQILANTLDLLIELLFLLNRIFSGMGFSRIYISNKEMIWVILLVLFIVSLYMLIKYNIRYRSYIIPSLAGIFLFWGWIYTGTEPEARVTFLDVGQGDAALISIPDGSSWLIDAGGVFEDYNAGERHILPFFRWSGIRKLDGIFISHLNSDHFGGLAEILNSIKCDTLYFSTELTTGKEMDDLKKIINEKNIPVRILDAGDVVRRNSTYRIEVLSPEEGVTFENTPINETSLVLRFCYGDIPFLFTGDIGFSTENTLLKYGQYLRSAVLKTAHHGSNRSSSTAFLRMVRPEYAVIQAGRFNSFGHPAKETLNRLTDSGAEVLRTDLSGAIIFSTDGKKINLVKK